MPTDYQAAAAKISARRLALYEREVNAALRKALVEIRAKIGRLYERYAIDGILTHAEMSKAQRLVTAERQIVSDLNKAVGENLKTFGKLHPEMYESGFYTMAWSIDSEIELRLAWGAINRNAITENLANEMYKLSLRRYGPDARILVREAINDGLINGKSYDAMMRDIRGALNTTSGRAMRIVRTEGQRAVEAGQDHTWARAGALDVGGDVKWLSTLDGRTRPTTAKQAAAGYNHRDMDGVARGEDGLFTMPNGEKTPTPLGPGLSAGNLINCRCDTRYEIAEYSPQIRRARGEGLIPPQTYREWEAGRTATR